MTSNEPKHKASPELKSPTLPYTFITEGEDLIGIDDYVIAAQQSTSSPVEASSERSRSSRREVAMLTFATGVLVAIMLQQGHAQSSSHPAPSPDRSTPNQVSFQNPTTPLHQ